MIYPLAFPSKAPNSERLTISRKQSATESTFTYAIQVVGGASQWQLEWTWGAMSHVRAEALAGWLDSLNGQVGTFTYAPRQSVTSTLTGKSLGAAAYGYNKTISATGWAANAPSTLRVGQFLQIGSQLLRITGAGAKADASGKVTISFEPELRVNYTNGTALNFINPTGTFRLNSSEGAGYTLTPDRVPELGSFQAREVVS